MSSFCCFALPLLVSSSGCVVDILVLYYHRLEVISGKINMNGWITSESPNIKVVFFVFLSLDYFLRLLFKMNDCDKNNNKHNKGKDEDEKRRKKKLYI